MYGSLIKTVSATFPGSIKLEERTCDRIHRHYSKPRLTLKALRQYIAETSWYMIYCILSRISLLVRKVHARGMAGLVWEHEETICRVLHSKKEMRLEQAEAQVLKDNQEREAQEAELRRRDKKDAQRKREKEARQKQQEANKSSVSHQDDI
ncbi:hypothetical protein BPOR_0038g00060 [Botrytis porri]|uniref:Uncharacterized protein n=1 Tax=Botrytis porri TaxID=87229 RepID=A0A4Z1L2U9_9HELO|nr:hypothetical protein BPOR_0038g00060 [Botrytis porri]